MRSVECVGGGVYRLVLSSSDYSLLTDGLNEFVDFFCMDSSSSSVLFNVMGFDLEGARAVASDVSDAYVAACELLSGGGPSSSGDSCIDSGGICIELIGEDQRTARHVVTLPESVLWLLLGSLGEAIYKSNSCFELFLAWSYGYCRAFLDDVLVLVDRASVCPGVHVSSAGLVDDRTRVSHSVIHLRAVRSQGLQSEDLDPVLSCVQGVFTATVRPVDFVRALVVAMNMPPGWAAEVARWDRLVSEGRPDVEMLCDDQVLEVINEWAVQRFAVSPCSQVVIRSTGRATGVGDVSGVRGVERVSAGVFRVVVSQDELGLLCRGARARADNQGVLRRCRFTVFGFSQDQVRDVAAQVEAALLRPSREGRADGRVRCLGFDRAGRFEVVMPEVWLWVMVAAMGEYVGFGNASREVLGPTQEECQAFVDEMVILLERASCQEGPQWSSVDIVRSRARVCATTLRGVARSGEGLTLGDVEDMREILGHSATPEGFARALVLGLDMPPSRADAAGRWVGVALPGSDRSGLLSDQGMLEIVNEWATRRYVPQPSPPTHS